MPIRQNILRKGNLKQNLLEFDVFQEETGVLGDLSTSRFFKISEFPSVLPTGNSSFLIEGSDLLKPNVELKTTYNIRFQKPISINKKYKKHSTYSFLWNPRLTVSELVKVLFNQYIRAIKEQKQLLVVYR